MWQPGDLIQPEVQLGGLQEIAAGKMNAFLDRYQPHDSSDVIRLPRAGAAFGVAPLLDLDEMRERFGKWPPLQWKVLNARKYRS